MGIRTAHRRRVRPAVRTAAALVASAALLAGCGLQSSGTFTPTAGPGEIKPVADAAGVAISVGAKNFSEQLILGKIGVIALQVAGFDVSDRSGIPGAAPARAAMTSGETDLQFDYTGTAWLNYLGQEQGIPDQQEQYEAVRDADAPNGITWLPPAPANNTYAFAVRSDPGGDLDGVKTLSDVAKLPVSERTFCIESEFASRNDGFEPMLAAYGLKLGDPDGVPRENVHVLDTGAVYTATAGGDTCNFGEVFTTDGRIVSLDLGVLDDDQQFFPAYNIDVAVLTSTLQAHPEIADIFGTVSSEITDDVMKELNRKVDVAGEQPAQVAYDWMRSVGLVS